MLCDMAVTEHEVSSHWSSFVTGLSRLMSNMLCLRCFLRFILDRSLSNTSPERRADTKSSNSPPFSSSLAFLAFCSLSFFRWRRGEMSVRYIPVQIYNSLLSELIIWSNLCLHECPSLLLLLASGQVLVVLFGLVKRCEETVEDPKELIWLQLGQVFSKVSHCPFKLQQES